MFIRLKTCAWKTPKNTVKEKQLKAGSCDTAKGLFMGHRQRLVRWTQRKARSCDSAKGMDLYIGPWLNKGLFAGHSERLVHATQLNACLLDTAKGLFVGHG